MSTQQTPPEHWTAGDGGPHPSIPGGEPTQWQSPRPPRRRGPLIALVLGVVAALTLLGVGGVSLLVTAPLQQLMSPPGEPVTSSDPVQTPDPPASPDQPPAPSPRPEPGPTTWQLPDQEWAPVPPLSTSDEIWAQLQAIQLLDEAPALLSGCPAPQTVDTEAEYRELVLQQWRCIHASWVPMFKRLGFSTVEPRVMFFTGEGSASDCGYLEAPAFYCSAELGSVYFGSGHQEMAMDWDLSINEMVNHEYGHHLQNVAGITEAKLQLEQTDEIERRAELQATCWSAAMTYNNEDVGFGEDDWYGWQNRLETMTLDNVHGSRGSILHWGTRGLYAKTFQDCNTWAVKAGEVS